MTKRHEAVTDTLCEAVRLAFVIIGLPLRALRWMAGEPEVRR